ncbi:MAG: DUF3579 domain-containing protein [Gammaproteobacteria bacterium]|nr:DUF3579 domain-containing protein [Gammaproteobacteria bacterium]MDH5650571.1 DUF3579 domain-containing protein [Gammaproteobacteria bacterium]
MTIRTNGFYIFGINQLGNKFRPSDWVERIASTFGNYDTNHRLQYHPDIMPTRFEGEKCLFVAEALARTNPVAYRFIVDFVTGNGLKTFIPGQPLLPVASFVFPRAA